MERLFPTLFAFVSFFGSTEGDNQRPVISTQAEGRSTWPGLPRVAGWNIKKRPLGQAPINRDFF